MLIVRGESVYILLEGRCKTIKEKSGQKHSNSLTYTIQAWGGGHIQQKAIYSSEYPVFHLQRDCVNWEMWRNANSEIWALQKYFGLNLIKELSILKMKASK